MVSDSSHCRNHPDKLARRRCYQCLSPICPACQRRAIGHIFCSIKCQTLCWLSERTVQARRFYLRTTLKVRRVERSVEKATGGGAARLLSLFLLLIILSQTMELVDTVSDLSGTGPAAATLAPPDLQLADEGEWVLISGSAPGFSMAVLLADGKERDVCGISEGRFSFNFRPDGKDRSLQVQVFGDNLPSLYSRSLPIPGPAEPAQSAGSTVEKQQSRSRQAAAKPPSSPAPSAKQAVVDAPRTAQGAATVQRRSSEDFSRGDPGTGRVAITFDGGSHGNAAARILDVLQERDLRATFFLTAEFMNRFPDLTRRIAREGHEVGNHTYSHLHLTTFAKNLRHDTLPGINREILVKELRKNEDLYTRLTGEKMVPLWRAPYGEQNETIRRWAYEAGYRHVSWTYDSKTRKSLDGLDWVSDRDSALYLSSGQIVDKILAFDHQTELGLAGGIVLLHLGSERKEDPFYPRLGQLIDELEERGYSVGSVSSLIVPSGGEG